MEKYAHMEKPWKKYYDSVDKIELPNVNATEYLKKRNINRGNSIAESYYGKETTFSEFFSEIDIYSKILLELGMKKGNTLMYFVPNLPESGKLWMGATQLGITSNFVDPRPDTMDAKINAQKILEILKYEGANYIVALDICYASMLVPIEDELLKMGIDTIILLDAQSSMNLEGKLSYLKDVICYNQINNSKNAENKINMMKALSSKMKQMQNQKKLTNEMISKSKLKIVRLNDLLKEYSKVDFDTDDDLKSKIYVGHTSGTSGSRPKPIVATNEQAISTLEQLKLGKVNFEPNGLSLNVLPFFAPFGAFDNYLLSLSSGCGNIVVPEFDISEFGYLLKKYKPNVIMATPSWLASLLSCGYLAHEDLSCVNRVIYGGDSMSPSDEEKLNEFFKNHGSSVKIEKGYGMSEVMGCASYAKEKYNKLSSIGIPLPNTTFAIVDPLVDDKLVPIKMEDGKNTVGELAISSRAVTPGIVNNQIIVPHYTLDGDEYIRTRDIVSMDENGIFYHQSRKDRSFARFDGYKYKPYEVEKILCNNPLIKNIMIVEYYDEQKKGLMPVCHIVLNNEYDIDETEFVRELIENQILNNPLLTSRHVPSKFVIRKEMPITKNGKIDYNTLKNEEFSGNEINVEINESNLKVDSIKIYKSNSKILCKK